MSTTKPKRSGQTPTGEPAAPVLSPTARKRLEQLSLLEQDEALLVLRRLKKSRGKKTPGGQQKWDDITLPIVRYLFARARIQGRTYDESVQLVADIYGLAWKTAASVVSRSNARPEDIPDDEWVFYISGGTVTPFGPAHPDLPRPAMVPLINPPGTAKKT